MYYLRPMPIYRPNRYDDDEDALPWFVKALFVAVAGVVFFGLVLLAR